MGAMGAEILNCVGGGELQDRRGTNGKAEESGSFVVRNPLLEDWRRAPVGDGGRLEAADQESGCGMRRNALMMSCGVEPAKQDVSFRGIVRGPEIVSDGDGWKEDEEQHAEGKELRCRVLRSGVRVTPTHEGSGSDQHPRDIEDYFHDSRAPVAADSMSE
jgi:hypothetical protein